MGALVTIADNLSRGNINNIAPIKKFIRFLHVDLRKESDCLQATRDQDIVLISQRSIRESIMILAEQKKCLKKICFSMMPIRAAATSGVKTFTQVSSASIYSTSAMVKRLPTKKLTTKKNLRTQNSATLSPKEWARGLLPGMPQTLQ